MKSPGPDFSCLAVDVRHGAAGEDVDPFLFEHVCVIGEAVLARRQLYQTHVRTAHAGETRKPRGAKERVRV